MTKKLPATIFFGSGPVAAKSLELLLEWQDVAAIVTKHSPKHHKEEAPVESLANKLGLKILYADNKLELDNLITNHDLPKTKFGIVIDYGVIISPLAINYFELGIINSHFSLLPQWRGADPITYSLLSGQEKTGVSLMLIDKGMDTGPLLATKELKITNTDDSPSLTIKLINLSNQLLIDYLPMYICGELSPAPQPDNKIITYSAVLNKNSGVLKPNKTVAELAREIRAYQGWPNSRLEYNGLWITVTNAQADDKQIEFGKLAYQNDKLLYGCKNGSLNIIELKPAGKKNMSAKAFINGYAHIIQLR